MKAKKEILILIAIIIVLGVYLTQRRTDRTHYELPVLEAVESAKIDKIEVIQDGTTLTVHKKDTKWYIAPEDKLADATKTGDMAKALAELKVTALVSEAASYSRYELGDKTKITLKGWQGGTLVREFDLGKAAGTFQHTFVKLPDNPNVYHAQGHLRPKFEQDAEGLRDLVVLALKDAEIQSVTITRDAATATFNRQAAPETEAATEAEPEAGGDGDTAEGESGPETAPPSPPQWINSATDEPIAAEKMDELLQEFSKLECARYIGDQTSTDYQNLVPKYKLVFQGAETHELALFAPPEESGSEGAQDYSGLSSQNSDPFTLAQWKVEGIAEKISNLIGPEAEEENETAQEGPEEMD